MEKNANRPTRKRRNWPRTKKPKRRRKRRSSSIPLRYRRVLLGLGSNLGDRYFHLASALREISGLAPLVRLSSLYESEPVGYEDQPPFWNLAAEIRWSGDPEELLEQLAAIEHRVGRQPRFRNGPREIDIDILDFAGQVRDSPDPVLPHPRLAARRFALAPLAEIAPRWRHPVTGLTAREMIKTLPAKPSVWRLRKKTLPSSFPRY